MQGLLVHQDLLVAGCDAVVVGKGGGVAVPGDEVVWDVGGADHGDESVSEVG